jgi:hypothetical protein
MEMTKEIGLKTQINRQVGLKKWQEKQKNNVYKHIVISWKMLYTKMPSSTTALIWSFVEDKDTATLFINTNSKNVGVKSHIGDYVSDKTGAISKCHFTENGKYIGNVKRLGNEPVDYTGYFAIVRSRFVIDGDKFSTAVNITDLFKGRYA